MNIQLDIVRICGFRGIANIELNLPRVTVLLGQNNAGKTSIIKALQLALGDYSRYLTNEDFHIDNNENIQEKIIIDVRFVPIEDGLVVKEFSEDWVREFKDSIQFSADAQQFVAIRTIVQSEEIKGGYKIDRFHLEEWPPLKDWEKTSVNQKNKLKKRFDSVVFTFIDAQRDIHSELKERSSYIGRVISSVKYDREDTEQIEQMVAAINAEATNKSEALTKLKNHLNALNESFSDTGITELAPFPKKIRDLSKRFSVHYGDTSNASFSMEYHGMGTRSWASMLSVKAFTDLQREKYLEECLPIYSIIAAEEPEAHLHPNAQRTVYNQLVDSMGQVIISSHSPYVAGLSSIYELRYLKLIDGCVKVFQLSDSFDGDDLRKLRREVIQSRGELLFSKAIVLFEGETEEQILPDLFEMYIGRTAFELGVNFVCVNGSGAKYRPFFTLAKDLNIPVYIFSDGEPQTVRELKKNYTKIFGEVDLEASKNITILDDTDFEGYLLEQNFMELIEESIKREKGANFIEDWIENKHGSLSGRVKTSKPPCSSCDQPIFESKLRDYQGDDGRKRAILDILDSSKPQYARAIADSLLKLPINALPTKIIELFEKINLGLSNEAIKTTTANSYCAN